MLMCNYATQLNHLNGNLQFRFETHYPPIETLFPQLCLKYQKTYLPQYERPSDLVVEFKWFRESCVCFKHYLTLYVSYGFTQMLSVPELAVTPAEVFEERYNQRPCGQER